MTKHDGRPFKWETELQRSLDWFNSHGLNQALHYMQESSDRSNSYLSFFVTGIQFVKGILWSESTHYPVFLTLRSAVGQNLVQRRTNGETAANAN